jgi:hypothetical protein
MSATTSSNDFRAEAGMGKDADWSFLPTEEVTRRHILVRHLWLLNKKELQWVTDIFLRRGTANRIMEFINEDHEYKDRLEHMNKLWDIEYIGMGRETLDIALKQKDTEEFMISFRENSFVSLYVAIIRKGTAKGYVRELS